MTKEHTLEAIEMFRSAQTSYNHAVAQHNVAVCNPACAIVKELRGEQWEEYEYQGQHNGHGIVGVYTKCGVMCNPWDHSPQLLATYEIPLEVLHLPVKQAIHEMGRLRSTRITRLLTEANKRGTGK